MTTFPLMPRKLKVQQGTIAVPVKTPAEDWRLADGALWTPSGTNLQERSGVVAGAPAPGKSEPLQVDTAAGGVFTVNPGRFYLQGSAALQGGYVGIVDAATTVTIAGADLPAAGSFKAGLLICHGYDQVYGDTKDGWALEYALGASASTSGGAVAPTQPTNSLLLRQFTVDSTGAITLGSYLPPFTVPRGGVDPVRATDATSGAYGGQYRDFPLAVTNSPGGGGGPQRWNSATSSWQSVSPIDWPAYRAYQTSIATGLSASTWYSMGMQTVAIDTHGVWVSTQNDRFTCPVGQAGIYAVNGTVSFVGSANGISADVRIAKNGVGVYGSQSMLGEVNSVQLQLTTGLQLVAMVPGDYVTVQGYYAVNAWSTLVGGAGNEGISSSLQAFRIR